MTPTRPRTLLLIGAIALGVTWALLTVVYASLPPLTWTLVPALMIGAALEAWTGRDLRARIQGGAGARPVPLLFVARMVALAKASSQAAALLAGVSAGFVGYLSGMTDAPTPRSGASFRISACGICVMTVTVRVLLKPCRRRLRETASCSGRRRTCRSLWRAPASHAVRPPRP